MLEVKTQKNYKKADKKRERETDVGAATEFIMTGDLASLKKNPTYKHKT